MSATYLAEAIRAIAAKPSPMGLRELARIAEQVGRMEKVLDEIVAVAQIEATNSQPWSIVR